MINSGHISACITNVDQFRRFRAGLITLRSYGEVRMVMWQEMVLDDNTSLTIHPAIARYDQLWPDLTQHIQFWFILGMSAWNSYVCLISTAAKLQILHNMACNGPVIPVVGNGGQQWSRISSLKELVHFKTELRNLGLVYHVMAFLALWDKVGQFWSKIVYNGPTFVVVSRYDRLLPYLSLYYLFFGLLVRFDHIAVKVPRKRKSG